MKSKSGSKGVDVLEYLCPLCNGLIEYNVSCSRCSSSMKNGGRIQDFYDNYSPYLSYELTDIMDGEPSNVCQHIFTCPVCGSDSVVNIDKMYL
jgi:Zn finger protein HypA/HybF involved in hydrogenase expression